MWEQIGPAIGSQLIGGIINRDMQRETNFESREAAREQMGFQAGMSDTAHQREVKDLIAAGLNPVLSAGGSGASTPSGASPSLQAPKLEFPNFFEAVSTTAQLAMEKQRIDLESRKLDQADRMLDASVPNVKAKTKNVEADTKYEKGKTPWSAIGQGINDMIKDLRKATDKKFPIKDGMQWFRDKMDKRDKYYKNLRRELP